MIQSNICFEADFNYKNNQKVIVLAKKVTKQANEYRKQLNKCQKKLNRNKYIFF